MPSTSHKDSFLFCMNSHVVTTYFYRNYFTSMIFASVKSLSKMCFQVCLKSQQFQSWLKWSALLKAILYVAVLHCFLFQKDRNKMCMWPCRWIFSLRADIKFKTFIAWQSYWIYTLIPMGQQQLAVGVFCDQKTALLIYDSKYMQGVQ